MPRLTASLTDLQQRTRGRAAAAERGIYLGGYYDEESRQVGANIVYEGDRHGIVFGPTGSGKGIRFLMVNLLGDFLAGKSVIVLDPKGELAAVTALQRFRLHGPGSVKIIDPFGKLEEMVGGSAAHQALRTNGLIESCGFNPLAALEPGTDQFPNLTFYDDASGVGEALVQIPDYGESHWSESARLLVKGLVMWEVIKARRQGRPPSLANVRLMMTEPELDANGRRPEAVEHIVTGLRAAAADMYLTGRYDLKSIAGRFVETNREIRSIVSSADTQLEWLLSAPMRHDMEKPSGVNFRELKEKPITVYVVLPAERMRTHSGWLRLVLVSALRALYRHGGVPTVMLIDEMAALGHLGPIEDAYGLVRGYGVQIVGIVQDLTQLQRIYKDRWESVIGNAGFVQGFAPNDQTTTDWMSKHSLQTTIIVRSVSETKQTSGNSASTSRTESWSQAPQMSYMPADLRGLPEGVSVLWLAGLAKTVPLYGEIYAKVEPYRSRALPNPYHKP